MLRHKGRLEPLHQGFELVEMGTVDRIDGTDREPYSVKAERVPAPDLLESTQRSASLSKIIFRMRLHPGDRRRLLQNFSEVVRAKPDPGLRRDRGLHMTSHREASYIFFIIISFIFARSSFVMASTVPFAILVHNPFG